MHRASRRQDNETDPLEYLWPDDAGPRPAHPVVTGMDFAPEAAQAVYVHTDQHACPRCAQRCVNIHTADYRRGTTSRAALAAIASALGGALILLITWLTQPMTTGVLLGSTLGAAGWAIAMVSVAFAGRRVTPNFWPADAAEWKRTGTVLAWTLFQVAVAIAPSYIALWLFFGGALFAS